MAVIVLMALRVALPDRVALVPPELITIEPNSTTFGTREVFVQQNGKWLNAGWQLAPAGDPR